MKDKGEDIFSDITLWFHCVILEDTDSGIIPSYPFKARKEE